MKNLLNLPRSASRIGIEPFLGIFEKLLVGHRQRLHAPLPKAASIEVFDLKSLRDDSRPTESMVF